MKSMLAGLFLVSAVITCSGCGGDSTTDDLKALGLVHANYQDAHREAPKNWDELLEYAREEMAEDVAALERIQDQDFTIAWGVGFRDVQGGAHSYVLAYQDGGGPTLMLDGGVSPLTAEELQAKLDAQPEPQTEP